MGDFIIVGVFVASFFLGIKHSLDVDHVAAVSSLMLRSPKITHTIKMAIFWSLGHTLTAGILTVVLFLMKDVFLTSFLAGFELIIAIMLIFIGMTTIILESIKKPDFIHIHVHIIFISSRRAIIIILLISILIKGMDLELKIIMLQLY